MRDFITQEERARLHVIVDSAIDKLNNEKNRSKPHWENESFDVLEARAQAEAAELRLAVVQCDPLGIYDEGLDLINLGLFVCDNSTRETIDR